MSRSCRFHTDRLFGIGCYVNVIEVADIMARWEIRTDTPVEKIAIKTCWFNGGHISGANDSWLYRWVTLPSLRVHCPRTSFRFLINMNLEKILKIGSVYR
jgi:hypothetical protein